jgi:putative membrane protein
MNDTTKGRDSTSSISQPVDKNTTEFAIKAADGGLLEVQLGKLAEKKAMGERVRNFGEMMVEDHTKLNDDLKTRATSQNVSLPNTPDGDGQKLINRLSSKSGEDFDKAYMKMMVEDHKKDLAEFRKKADKGTNPVIKEFASMALPVLEKHLDSAQAIYARQ